MPANPHHTTVTWFAKDMVEVYAIAVIIPIVLTIASRVRSRIQYLRSIGYYAADVPQELGVPSA